MKKTAKHPFPGYPHKVTIQLSEEAYEARKRLIQAYRKKALPREVDSMVYTRIEESLEE